ncbi:Metallo-dependent phosphatase [Lecanosticta acicola]|uniref:Metallo-dependent phosphatase n=1 Tax=Lecanosticta acicola TaxID=111012 RepID=A0AAI9E8L7_9PEZI|nr:Metallo-dependent phosphatase [Lecanosticta acicola]
MDDTTSPTPAQEESLSAYRARLKGQQQAKPLIEQVSNQWKSDKADPYGTDEEFQEIGFCDLDEEGSCANVSRDIVASRRFRRMIAYALLFGVALYYLWSRYVQPPLDDEWAYKEGFVSQKNGTYGIAQGGDLDADLVRIKDLDNHLLPGGPHDPDGKRRLVFVGDVHGCKKELIELLEEVGFREETDHLVLTGDVISKGPDNVGVLDELIRLNATSVRGNHEDRILHVAENLDLTATDVPSEQSTSKGFSKDAAIYRQLKPHHVRYLRDMPLMLHISSLPQALTPTKKDSSPIAEHMLVVHAGLVPGVRLSKQDPYFVMNMRSINRRTHVPSAQREGKNAKPWYDLWGWYNKRIFKRLSTDNFHITLDEQSEALGASGSDYWPSTLWKNFFGSRKSHLKPQVVVYGHDSKSGLQINRFSKGLDSGCVGGGKLTAMTLDAKGRTRFFHVGCDNYRG